MGGPASIVFHARDGRSSSSLAKLVDRFSPLDASALAGWALRWAPNRVEDTPYRDVRAELVTRPLARGTIASETHPPPRLAEAPAVLRRALDAAVDKALFGIRRAAVMTGGGLDSSVLLALTTRWAERTGGSVFAVALDFEGPGDDRPHLAALEAHLKCEVLRVVPEDCAARVAMLEGGADAAPAYSATMMFEVEMLARARANGAERILSGVGGDELFGGEPRTLAELALAGHPVRALRAARRLTGFERPTSPALSWVMRPLVARALPLGLRRWRARLGRRDDAPEWAGPAARSFLRESRRHDIARVRRSPKSARERFEMVRADPRRSVLAWGRQLEESLTGLDGWDPYLDLDLAAAVTALPPHFLLHGDRWRGLLREAARDLLPASVRERMDKASFEPALQRIMEAAGGLEVLRPLASARELAALGLVEPRAFEAAFERFVADQGNGVSWMALWSALAVEAFLRGRKQAAS